MFNLPENCRSKEKIYNHRHLSTFVSNQGNEIIEDILTTIFHVYLYKQTNIRLSNNVICIFQIEEISSLAISIYRFKKLHFSNFIAFPPITAIGRISEADDCND